jgi:hypothetical protein
MRCNLAHGHNRKQTCQCEFVQAQNSSHNSQHFHHWCRKDRRHVLTTAVHPNTFPLHSHGQPIDQSSCPWCPFHSTLGSTSCTWLLSLTPMNPHRTQMRQPSAMRGTIEKPSHPEYRVVECRKGWFLTDTATPAHVRKKMRWKKKVSKSVESAVQGTSVEAGNGKKESPGTRYSQQQVLRMESGSFGT